MLQISLQHGCVPEKSATRMHLHLVQNPQIPTSSPATWMQRQKNLQRRCVAEPKTCTEIPGTCTKNPVQIYIRTDAMGQENKIQSRHISTDTQRLRAKKELSHAVHICHNKNAGQMSASAPAAPSAATIYNSKDNGQMMGEVSDIVNSDTQHYCRQQRHKR
jgi:hypothetical protein